MGRKSKLSKEQIAESILLIDGKKISLRKRAVELGISHPQLRDSIIKYKKEEKEKIGTTQILKDNLESIKNRKKNLELSKIDEISKGIDDELYKDHKENDQEINEEEYNEVVGSLRKQYNVEEKPKKKPIEDRTIEKQPYVSLTFLWHMHEHIYGKSDGHKNSRDALLDKFIEELKKQKKIVRGS